MLQKYNKETSSPAEYFSYLKTLGLQDQVKLLKDAVLTDVELSKSSEFCDWAKTQDLEQINKIVEALASGESS